MKKIYVSNFPYEVTEEDLKKVFEEYGTVTSVHIEVDRETGTRKGYAFIAMETGLHEAVEALDGADWNGRTLKVNFARERGGGPSRHHHY